MENISLPRTLPTRPVPLDPQTNQPKFVRRPLLTFAEREALKAERQAEGDKALAEIHEREKTIRANMERLRAMRLAKEDG